MKKHTKKLLGICGLVLVAAMTFVATQIPSPSASAMTDVISIKVVDSIASLEFTEPENGYTTYNPELHLGFNYSSATKVVLSLVHTDKDGKKTENPSYWSRDLEAMDPGDVALVINMEDFGYGTYNFTLYGYDVNGAPTAQKSLLINYVPTVTKIDMEEDGTLDMEFDYDDEIVDKIVITVKNDKTGKTNTVTLDGGETDAQISSAILKELGGDGDYTVSVSSYNKSGKLLYTSIFHVEVVGVPNTGAPDTGAFLRDANISSEDFAITGVLVFFVLAVVALGIVMKSHKSAKASMRRK